MLRSLRLVAALLIAMLALIGACTAPARPARALAPALLINEFMPRPGTGGEWAELINLGDTDLDLAGWAIDDDTIGGTRTLIAAGTSAPAHGLLLVALTANILNDTGTDAIQLSDPAGTLIDSFAYSSASAGQSYARMPDGGTSWLKGVPSPGAWNSSATPTMPVTPSSAPAATNTPSPTATTSPTYTPTATNTATASATATPYLPGILLNEFVAYPKTLYTNEWVELYNSGDILVDLSGWKIDDSEGGQSPYALPPGSLLAAGGYLVVELPSAILNNGQRRRQPAWLLDTWTAAWPMRPAIAPPAPTSAAVAPMISPGNGERDQYTRRQTCRRPPPRQPCRQPRPAPVRRPRRQPRPAPARRPRRQPRPAPARRPRRQPRPAPARPALRRPCGRTAS
ncbi:MAG: lamin tail domain-containing protein [Kouleothrix sp.]